MPMRNGAGLLEELRATLYCIGDAVITTDASGAVCRMNPVAEALTGWREAEAAGKPLPEVFVIENEETGRRMEDPVALVVPCHRVIQSGGRLGGYGGGLDLKRRLLAMEQSVRHQGALL